MPSGTTAKPRSGTTASATTTTTVPGQMLSGSPAVPAGTCLVLPLENINLIRESPPVLPLEQRYYRYLTWNGTTAAPTVLPLPACRNREYSLVSLSHLPPLGLDNKYPLLCLGLGIDYVLRLE